MALSPFAFETITVSTTVLSLTSSVYVPTGGRPAELAIITPDDTLGNNLRYWPSATNPSAGADQGHLWATGRIPRIILFGIRNIENFRIVRDGAADVVISISYYD